MLSFILLGVLQGLTEFLPVSSSGHLALAEQFLHIRKPGIVFDILVHFGTVLAVLYVFRQRVWQLVLSVLQPSAHRRLLFLLVIGSIPTGILGLLLENMAEAAFARSWAVGLGLLATAIVLFAVERRPQAPEQTKSLEQLSWQDAVWIGIAQGLAVFPGVSRSGSTIAAGLARSLKREVAAEFSFLLAVPAILAATGLKISEALAEPAVHSSLWLEYLAGVLAAFVLGAIAIRFLMHLLQRSRLDLFAYYCAALGVAAILWRLVK